MTIFAKLLPPGVQVGEEIERSPGLFIGGANLNNSLVSYLKQGPNIPLKDMSFVIGIQGRGTLNIPGSEYMDLLATMTALAKSIAGLSDEPITVNFTEVAVAGEQRLRDIFAEELDREGATALAAMVRSGCDNSPGGSAAMAALRRVVAAVPLDPISGE